MSGSRARQGIVSSTPREEGEPRRSVSAGNPGPAAGFAGGLEGSVQLDESLFFSPSSFSFRPPGMATAREDKCDAGPSSRRGTEDGNGVRIRRGLDGGPETPSSTVVTTATASTTDTSLTDTGTTGQVPKLLDFFDMSDADSNREFREAREYVEELREFSLDRIALEGSLGGPRNRLAGLNVPILARYAFQVRRWLFEIVEQVFISLPPYAISKCSKCRCREPKATASNKGGHAFDETNFPQPSFLRHSIACNHRKHDTYGAVIPVTFLLQSMKECWRYRGLAVHSVRRDIDMRKKQELVREQLALSVRAVNNLTRTLRKSDLRTVLDQGEDKGENSLLHLEPQDQRALRLEIAAAQARSTASYYDNRRLRRRGVVLRARRERLEGTLKYLTEAERGTVAVLERVMGQLRKQLALGKIEDRIFQEELKVVDRKGLNARRRLAVVEEQLLRYEGSRQQVSGRVYLQELVARLKEGSKLTSVKRLRSSKIQN